MRRSTTSFRVFSTIILRPIFCTRIPQVLLLKGVVFQGEVPCHTFCRGRPTLSPVGAIGAFGYQSPRFCWRRGDQVGMLSPASRLTARMAVPPLTAATNEMTPRSSVLASRAGMDRHARQTVKRRLSKMCEVVPGTRCASLTSRAETSPLPSIVRRWDLHSRQATRPCPPDSSSGVG